MDFTNIVDQIFLVLILIATILSIVIPFNQYMKDRNAYPLFQAIASLFYLDSAFVAFITLVSYIRSMMTLGDIGKAFNSFITLQIPSSLYGSMAVILAIIAIGLKTVSNGRRY